MRPAGQGSTLALPVGTFFLLVFLWFGVSIPLVFVGAYFGYKKPAIEHPVRTNIIARWVAWHGTAPYRTASNACAGNLVGGFRLLTAGSFGSLP